MTQTVPVDLIDPSPFNPRTYFDDAKLQELAESIKSKGVLQAPIVRPVGDRYELVVGERRWRASKIAELEEIPARVQELTDVEVLEIQVIENIERDDMTPLDEAFGYQALLGHGYTVARIAEKVHRPESYIAKRLALTKLTGNALEALQRQEIPLGHAIEIARLPVDLHDKVFKLAQSYDRTYFSLATFRANIERHIYAELKAAPFDRTDDQLVKKAGACTTCSKRSGAKGQLFDDLDGDRCFDQACFEKKVKAHIANLEEANPELIRIGSTTNGAARTVANWHTRPSTPEEGGVKAIQTQGVERGKIVYVTVTDRALTLLNETATEKAPTQPDLKRQADDFEKQRAIAKERRAELMRRIAALKSLKPTSALLCTLGQEYVDSVYLQDPEEAYKVLGLVPPEDIDLRQLFAPELKVSEILRRLLVLFVWERSFDDWVLQSLLTEVEVDIPTEREAKALIKAAAAAAAAPAEEEPKKKTKAKKPTAKKSGKRGMIKTTNLAADEPTAPEEQAEQEPKEA